jgi:hypothetical protein
MELEAVSRESWQSFVEMSSQGTIFHKPIFLESLELDCEYFLVKKKGVILGGMALPKSNNINIVSYQAYSGFIFHPEVMKKKPVKRIELQYQVLDFLANELVDRYNEINFRSIDYDHPIDLRPFHWLNYHEKDKPTFITSNVYYTSLLKTSSPLNQTELRKGRSSSLNKSKKFNLESELSGDIGEFEKIYLETFERQDVTLSADDIRLAKNLFSNLLTSKDAFFIATKYENEIVSMSMFATDQKRAYYLFGASKTEFRSKEVGTANLAWAIEYLHNHTKHEYLDMVGVNSPQRGSYKLSFGGSLVPYYQTRKISNR